MNATIPDIKSTADPILDRLNAAETLEEAFAIANAIPSDTDDDYDLEDALNRNREESGQRLLFPPKPDRTRA